MKHIHALLLSLLTASAGGQAVTNITCTEPLALQAMKGVHSPADYAATNVIDDHQQILCELRTRLSPDSLKSFLQRMEGFYTRHSYSDTVSPNTGIGAARRWAFGKFQEFSAANEDRLIPAYLQFDWPGGLCGDGLGWRNVFAVLPGADTTDHRIVLIEAHLDSRGREDCDATCLAAGMEDNGSGSALVLELARVMSRDTFRHTLVFLLTTAEEQGLIGARAMAQFCVDEAIAIKGVQNNDVVGGILCGETSSPPSCPAEGDVDSLQVRLFSSASLSSPHRGFARTVKMYYQEKMQSQVPVPMTISIMAQEDRTGRGGDHIPFRVKGFRNLRFTSANEHGDASTDSSWYNDRQQTSDDILGVDTDGDLIVDSFFVDFNYLQRNAVINGMSAALLALGPETPTFVVHDEPNGLRVSLNGAPSLAAYRIGVRSTNANLDFDAVYRTTDTSYVIPGLLAGDIYYISVAGIDSAGIMSPFSHESLKGNDADTPAAPTDQLPYGIACAPITVPEVVATMGTLTIVPDPASDIITLVTDQPMGNVVLLDMMGREVVRTRFVASVPITVASLPAGSYSVVLLGTDNSVRAHARFIKN